MSVIEINRDPSPRDLAIFGALLAIFAGVAGWLLRRQGAAPVAGAAVWGIGALLVAADLVVPPSRRPIYLGWMYAVFPIGWLISHAVLAAIYYLVFTPIGLVLRFTGRDPLARRFDRSTPTYWQPHAPVSHRRRYFRQY